MFPFVTRSKNCVTSVVIGFSNTKYVAVDIWNLQS
jgi:hypothetical protein